MAKPDKASKIFQDYLAKRKVLIADPSGSSRTGLMKTIVGLGAKTNNVIRVGDYERAVEAIEKEKPHVVICDYDLGAGQGLNLLQAQRLGQPSTKETLFVLVTGNSSQSAVAQAAEEDVDTFLLKPYTIEVLRQSLLKASLSKLFPSDYVKTVDEGKKILFEGKVDEAIKIFEKAATMNETPTLALFYHGQAELMKKLMDSAKDSYEKGLNFNKIHYKCLIGLFELLMSQNMHQEAYDVIKRVARYFPANPKRLATVLRLAVMTKKYEDIERYYQIFTTIDNRNDELIRYICAALVVCGKFYLQQKVNSRALDLFNKAGLTAVGRTKILREIVVTLAAYSMVGEGAKFLKRFPPDSQKGEDYRISEFLVTAQDGPPTQAIQKGRTIIQDGIHDPGVYKALIIRSMEAGMQPAANELVVEASKKWAAMAEVFAEAAAGAEAPAGDAKPPETKEEKKT